MSPDRSGWRAFAGRYLRPHRLRLSALLGLLVLTATLQISGPQVLRAFVDRALAGRPQSTLIQLALLFLAIAAANQALAVATAVVAERFAWKATNALRADIASHALHLDMPFHHRHAPGEMIERVDGDLLAVSDTASRFVTGAGGSVLVLAAVLVAVSVEDWRVGLALTAMTAAAVSIVIPRTRKARIASEEERAASAAHFDLIEERLSGLDDLRALAAADHSMRRFRGTARVLVKAWTTAHRVAAGIYVISIGLVALGSALVLALGAWRYRSGTMTVGTVYLMFQYVLMLRRPLEAMADQLKELQRASAAMVRARDLLAMEPAIVAGDVELPGGPLSVEWRHVTHSYGDDTPVIHDLSLHLPAGSTLGLVGRTGSGKTTLGRLVSRLYDPISGSVSIGGVDVRDISSASLRARVGVVGQDVHVFAGSVRDNVTLFDRTVPASAVESALREVGLGHWLGRQADGVDTELPPGGGVSAGEAQLIACARVFLLNPSVVILDEASSRLDPDTAERFNDAVARLLNGRTGIVVAHRLETVESLDAVAVIADGRLVEHGPPLVLASTDGSEFGALRRLAGAVGVLP